MARQARTTPFATVTGNLGQLSRGELEELADIVARLLALTADEVDLAFETNGADQVETKGGAGAIEFKMINGCGPYAYLRFWQGKTHRSRYLGKVGKNGAIVAPRQKEG